MPRYALSIFLLSFNFIQLYIACDCNGRADSCVFDSDLYMETNNGGRCVDCRNNTIGINCEQCDLYYYPEIGLPVNDSSYCTGEVNAIFIIIIMNVISTIFNGHPCACNNNSSINSL